MKTFLAAVCGLYATHCFAIELPPKELDCMERNAYFEAGNQHYEGIRAVVAVTLNRVESKIYPNNVCDVVWQKYQFSWTHDGKSDTPSNKKQFAKVKEYVALALKDYKGGYKLQNSMWFHNHTVNPKWAKQKKKIATIRDHTFYGDH